MKFLKISDSKGYFLNPLNLDNGEWVEMDKIEKDHLLGLLDKALHNEFEMDEFSEEAIKNKAHLIIYRNLYSKFSNLIENKSRFKDESEKVFSDALKKYKTGIADS